MPRTADAPTEHAPVGAVEVRRSRNRTRTVTAYRDGDRTIIAIPARFTRAQEREWVQRMVTRLERQERRRRPSDVQLAERAAGLSTRYLAGRARPASVTWSSNQGRRWGSCTPLDGTIRVSDRLQGMPGWVLDYVLLHELAHLLHAGHGPDFWAELDSYPRTDRARGFLEGVAYGHERARTGQPPTLGGDVDDEGDVTDEPDDDAGDAALDVVDEIGTDPGER
ncbi:YgjP-like metallopeptidase domain-containing protein [Cellulomonas sp. 179-A 4D5 NHS]